MHQMDCLPVISEIFIQAKSSLFYYNFAWNPFLPQHISLNLRPIPTWQPHSAPLMEALRLMRAPMAAAVRRNSPMREGEAPGTWSSQYLMTEGMTPAAPLVGAVTTRPPAAFS